MQIALLHPVQYLPTVVYLYWWLYGWRKLWPWFIAAVPDDDHQNLLRRKYSQGILKLYETSKAWSLIPRQAFTKALLYDCLNRISSFCKIVRTALPPQVFNIGTVIDQLKFNPMLTTWTGNSLPRILPELKILFLIDQLNFWFQCRKPEQETQFLNPYQTCSDIHSYRLTAFLVPMWIPELEILLRKS